MDEEFMEGRGYRVMHAVILAAGKGTRLHPYSVDTPKPLVKILDKAVIEHTIHSLREARIRDLVIVIGYLGHIIRKRLKDGGELGVRIRYCNNKRYMLENAISLKVAERKVPKNQLFLLLMGDHYYKSSMIETALRNVENPFLCVDKKPKVSTADQRCDQDPT